MTYEVKIYQKPPMAMFVGIAKEIARAEFEEKPIFKGYDHEYCHYTVNGVQHDVELTLTKNDLLIIQEINYGVFMTTNVGHKYSCDYGKLMDFVSTIVQKRKEYDRKEQQEWYNYYRSTFE